MGSFEALRDMVTCPIDYQEFDDPRLLPCGHVYCRNCLDRYLEKIQKTDSQGNKILDCPVCRRPVAIDARVGAASLNSSFHHKELLTFVRKHLEGADQVDGPRKHRTPNELTPNGSPMHSAENGYVAKRRRSSVYKHDLVKNMVDNVILGAEPTQDPTKLMSSLKEYLSQLDESQQISFINTTPVFNHSFSQPGPMNGLPMPSAPPLSRNESLENLRSIGSASRNDPNFCSGRFSGAPGRLKHNFYDEAPERPPSPKWDTGLFGRGLSYQQSCEVEKVREMMRKCSGYSRLYKDQGYCVLECDHRECVDMQILSLSPAQSSSPKLIRFAVALDQDRMCLFGRQVTISNPKQFTRSLKPDPIPLRNSDEIKRYSKLGESLHQLNPNIDRKSLICVKYIRYFNRRIYLTAVISRPPGALNRRHRHSGSSDVLEDDDTDWSGLDEIDHFGLVMWCVAPESFAVPDDLFEIRGISQPFAGPPHPYLPVILGLDIDRATGAVYVAMPSRSAIVYMDADLTRVENEWSLREPESFPEYLCFNAVHQEVWASCPREDKIVILNVNTNRLLHLRPSESFGIKPSHIVFTSDSKIVALDKEKSSLYWIAKVEMNMCVQKMDHSTANRKKTKIVSIQPMEEVVTFLPGTQNKQRCLIGGIVCTESAASYLIFPNQTLNEPSITQKLCQMWR